MTVSKKSMNRWMAMGLITVSAIFGSVSGAMDVTTMGSSNNASTTPQPLNFTKLSVVATITEPTAIASGAIFKLDFVDNTGAALNIKPPQVQASMMMPAMPGMGATRIGVTAVRDSMGAAIPGELAIKPTFSMSGTWEISVDVTINGVSDTQSFNVDVP